MAHGAVHTRRLQMLTVVGQGSRTGHGNCSSSRARMRLVVSRRIHPDCICPEARTTFAPAPTCRHWRSAPQLGSGGIARGKGGLAGGVGAPVRMDTSAGEAHRSGVGRSRTAAGTRLSEVTAEERAESMPGGDPGRSRKS